MAGKRFKPIEAGTAGILSTLIFLLAWSIVELMTDTRPKGAPSGTTFHTANQAGARTTPSEQPSALDNLRTASPRRQN
jgi:hypothetical protein